MLSLPTGASVAPLSPSATEPAQLDLAAPFRRALDGFELESTTRSPVNLDGRTLTEVVSNHRLRRRARR